ncbi:MAG: hypothetical protein ACOH2L_19215 [Devosia sp.]
MGNAKIDELRQQLRHLEREDLYLQHDCRREALAPLDVWGKGCWRKGHSYPGPFSIYEDGVIYQVGKAKPTSVQDGYRGDWSGVNELQEALAALDAEKYPDLS